MKNLGNPGINRFYVKKILFIIIHRLYYIFLDGDLKDVNAMCTKLSYVVNEAVWCAGKKGGKCRERVKKHRCRYTRHPYKAHARQYISSTKTDF